MDFYELSKADHIQTIYIACFKKIFRNPEDTFEEKHKVSFENCQNSFDKNFSFFANEFAKKNIGNN